MNITKKHLDDMQRCYCAGHVTIDGKPYALLASERIGGESYAYFGSDFSQKELVWKNAGGTMSIIEIPDSNGQFLGVQNFFPGFQAKGAKIVWGRRDADQGWLIQDFLSLPYVHRFDILSSGGINYLVAATLCGSKKDREDWSDPGKVYVGILPDDPDQTMEITPLLHDMVKNHGYWRGSLDGRACGFFTCESGVYAVVPPGISNTEWETHQLLQAPVSEVAVYDLDGDGEDEMITIEPFHGNRVKIYHKAEDGYRVVYTYPGEFNFAHALWAGRLRGKPAAILGIRRTNPELAIIQYCPQRGSYTESVIEKGGGPSNVDVISERERDVIICANNNNHEAALYFVTD